MRAVEETVRKYYKYQEETWVQPVLSSLTSYGTITQTDSISNVWKIFNDDATTSLMAGGLVNDIIWKFPTPVSFTTFHIESVYTLRVCNGIGSAALYKYNSSNEWELVTSTTFPGNTTQTYDANLTNFTTSKIKLVISSTNSAVNTGVRKCLFTGTQLVPVESTESDYDFYVDVPVYKIIKQNNVYKAVRSYMKGQYYGS